MTKKYKNLLDNILWRYGRSTEYSIYEAYKDPSSNKYYAEQNILEEMKELNGWGYKILEHNSCTFSCAYRYDRYIVFHTYLNRYVFDLTTFKEVK